MKTLCSFPSNSFDTLIGYLLETWRPFTLVFETEPPGVNFPAPNTRSVELQTALSNAEASVDIYTATSQEWQEEISDNDLVSITDLKTTPGRHLITDELLVTPANEDEISHSSMARSRVIFQENPYSRRTYLSKEFGI